MQYKIIVLLLMVFVSACDQTIPKIDLPPSVPEVKITNYSEALVQLGVMTEIYDTGSIRILSNQIGDVTGASSSTGSEIPRDITEMTKSALNSIGGNVLYIPYDPAFISNQMATGYSNFEHKIIPDVVITGGITEFDRGLETKGSSTELGVDATVGGESVGLDYGDQDKSGLARITLDYNMLNFQTMAGIPRMNTVNSMKVHKATGEKGFSVSLFGLTFGSKGEIKKVQGRHDAVRLLVELSMIQLVGKYAGIPYWRLLGDGVTEDKEVLRTVRLFYHNLSRDQRIENVQEWLYLQGYEAPFTGEMDDETNRLLKAFDPTHQLNSQDVSFETFSKLYLTIPVNYYVLSRRHQIKQRHADYKNRTKKHAKTHYVEKRKSKKRQLAIKMASDKLSYRVGDELKLYVRLSEDGYLRCYYQDGKGVLIQILPNPFNKNNRANKNQELQIPDAKLVGGNFSIEFMDPGVTERFICFAAEHEFVGSVPSSVIDDQFNPLPILSLSELASMITNASGGTVVNESLTINVK